MVGMKRSHFISLLAPALVFADRKPPAYEHRIVHGWTLVVSRRLLDEESTTATKALKLLNSKLQEIAKSVPKDAVTELRKVKIWLEHPKDGVSKCAAYHPSAKWLTDHGHNPAMECCVELGNPRLFIEWSDIQPSMVLHELAHAYHHQVLGHDYKPIEQAYANAIKNNLYTEVKHAGGKTKRAYALNNKKEFFAELTEAYFGRNDFFPFVQKELKQYDPKGFSAIETAWKIQATDKIEPAKD